MVHNGFCADWNKTLVSMATNIVNWLIIGKTMSPHFLYFIRSFSHLQITWSGIEYQTTSNFGQIGPLSTEYGARERLNNFPYTYNLKMVSPSYLVHFYWIFVKLAGNQDRHKISDEFEFRPVRISHTGVTRPWGRIKFSIYLWNLKNQLANHNQIVYVSIVGWLKGWF